LFIIVNLLGVIVANRDLHELFTKQFNGIFNDFIATYSDKSIAHLDKYGEKREISSWLERYRQNYFFSSSDNLTASQKKLTNKYLVEITEELLDYAVSYIHDAEFNKLVEQYITKLDKSYRTKLRDIFQDKKKNRKENFFDAVKKWSKEKPQKEEPTIFPQVYAPSNRVTLFEEECFVCGKKLHKNEYDIKNYPYECTICGKTYCQKHKFSRKHKCKNEDKSKKENYDEICHICGKGLLKKSSNLKKYAYKCVRCGKYFCQDHNSPKKHDCVNEYKKLKGVYKSIELVHKEPKEKSPKLEFDIECKVCGKSLSKRTSDPDKLAYECIYCDEYFCEDHKSAKNHNCPNVGDGDLPNQHAVENSLNKKKSKKLHIVSVEAIVSIIVLILFVGGLFYLTVPIEIPYEVSEYVLEEKTIEEEIQEEISIENYIRDRIDYYDTKVEVVGKLGYLYEGDENAGYWDYYIVDDMGKKLTLSELSVEQKDMFSKSKLSDKTYAVSGILKQNGLVPKIIVDEITNYNRKTSMKEKNILEEKEINYTKLNKTTRIKVLSNKFKIFFNNTNTTIFTSLFDKFKTHFETMTTEINQDSVDSSKKTSSRLVPDGPDHPACTRVTRANPNSPCWDGSSGCTRVRKANPRSPCYEG
jgi:predicted nucleic acid binding AN1-type Zn finger protein